MASAFQRLSQQLKEHPLRTNVVLSTFIGFCGDVMCQTVYDPFFGVTRVTRTSLPPESFASPLILRVPSPSLVWKKYQYQRRSTRKAGEPSDTNLPPSPCNSSRNEKSDRLASSAPTSEAVSVPTSSFNVDNCFVYLDLRRSFIFCSFSCLFSVPYFLWVYRHLDRFYPPAYVTKMQAIGKGFASYCAANLTTPLYMAHITLLDRFFIYRDGRDGRRRIHHSREGHKSLLFPSIDSLAIPPGIHGSSRTGSDTPSSSDSVKGCSTSSFPSSTHSEGKSIASGSISLATSVPLELALKCSPPPATVILEHEKGFNKEEYLRCVHHDWKKRLRHDFPDVLRCGLVFWGINWLPMFYYIPPHFRLLYSAMLQTVWSGVMSYMMHRGER